jgi:hypothetical protein
MTQPLNDDKIEAQTSHIEHGGQDVKDDIIKESDVAPHLTKSRFDQLGLWRTLWVFRRAALCCLAVYTGFLCEGFEVIPIISRSAMTLADSHSSAPVDQLSPTRDSSPNLVPYRRAALSCSDWTLHGVGLVVFSLHSLQGPC